MATLETALRRVRDLIPTSGYWFPVENINEMHDGTMGLGQRVADNVARTVGSWRFIIIQSVLLVMWISANVALGAHEASLYGFNLRAWDLAPFVLLNLMLSFEAAYTAPIIMMSQNRQADKDRIAAEHDFHVNIRAEATVHAVLAHLRAQDDVMLSILQQLQKVHGLKPDASQQRAEQALATCIREEKDKVWRQITEQERAAGLEASVPVEA
jgi:uncharacterized membrane protein